jgi:hypothetical protein
MSDLIETHLSAPGSPVTSSVVVARAATNELLLRAPLDRPRTVYVVRSDCDADRLLAVDSDVPAQSPPRAALVTGAALWTRPAADRIRRRVTIALACAAGCRGTLRLVQQRRSRRERVVGDADYGSAASTVLVRPAIARFARALAGCPGGLRVAAVLYPTGSSGRGKGLGAYRITSRARCRRSGGPSFTSPRPGPRP